jgi:predicted metal-binding membrane protein
VSLDRSLESIVRRDRAVTVAGLVALTLLAWLYLLKLHGETADMAGMGMVMEAWGLHDALMASVMWAIMMIAMMLPSAAPMILVFTSLNRKRRGDAGAPPVNIGLFVAGYLVVWGAFSVVAAAAQWGLQRAALLSADAMTVGPRVGAGVLVAAAVYQVTPLKYACLSRCRSPLGFLMSEWREGNTGALVMGLRHGLVCLGCCWLLMALLFVGGVMNLAWVAVLAAFVLLEKLLPTGRIVSWASSVVLLAGAGWLLLR